MTPRITESGLRARRRCDVERRHARLELLDAALQFRQPPKMTDAFRHSRLSMAGIAGDHRARLERVGHARLPDGDAPAADRQMAADADLPAEHHVVFDVRAAGDAHLRRHQHVAADGHAVRDLHQVVDLRARFDARLADRRAIDRGVRAELHVVFDDHGGDLRDLLVRAVAAADESVAVAADDDAVLQDDAVADR